MLPASINGALLQGLLMVGNGTAAFGWRTGGSGRSFMRRGHRLRALPSRSRAKSRRQGGQTAANAGGEFELTQYEVPDEVL
jgi:hypothetical protein